MSDCRTLEDVAPGSPAGIRSLAARIDTTADEAREARQETMGIAQTTGSVAWEGDAAEGFVQSVEKLPPLLALMGSSYDGVVAALGRYAEELEDLRARARRSCEDCAAARRRQAEAQRDLGGAEQRASALAGEQRSAWLEEQTARASAVVDPGAAAQLPALSSRRSQLDSSARQADQETERLRQELDDAEEDEEAAHRRLDQLSDEREDAEKACAERIRDALVEDLENPGFWEKAGNLVGDALDAVEEWVDEHADILTKISGVLKTVSAIAGVLSLIPGANVIFGPIAVAAGGAALLIDAVLVATGNGDWKTLLLDAALMALPGVGKLVKTALKPAAGAVKASRAAKAARGTVARLRPVLARSRGVQLGKRVLCGDPIDVATGEMVMSQTDVDLPGALALVLERTHVSSYREGRWFGPSWASTLDQRLEVDEQGVCYSASDGVILVYPITEGDDDVLPEEGQRWPLRRTEDGGYAVTDLDRDRTLHFAPSTVSTVLPLAAITNRNGSRIEVDYDGDGIIAEVRHSGGYRILAETSAGLITALKLRGTDGGSDSVLMRYGYDADGRLTEVVNSSNAPLRFQYDKAGRITQWDDRNGAWYGYTYDDDGRCVQTSGSGGCLDGTFVYDRENRVTLVTNSLGHQTTFDLNALDQVIREVDPLGNPTVSDWDRYDHLLRRTDPLGRTTSYVYDAAGNLETITRPDGSRVDVERNELGFPVRVVDADGVAWGRTYDVYGNLTGLVDPIGATTTYAYDAQRNLAAVTDALGQRHDVESDGAGLPIAVTDPFGSVTRYTRDGTGRVTAITDPIGGVTRLGWTVDGNLSWRSLPDGATERWTYDAEGNVVEHADAVGQRTSREVTHFDLPAAETGPDGARLEFSYDTELRLVAVRNPQGLEWRYDYDPAGNLVRETDFNGRILTYLHDAAGQLTQRTNGAGDVTRFGRDVLGNVTQQRSGDASTSVEYDAAGRIRRAVSADAELIYDRDPLGRVLGETCNGRTVTSAYDVLGRRVRRRTPSGAESVWTYDANNQPVALRTAEQVVRFEYDAAGRETERILGGTTVTQAWDANHRLRSQVMTSAGVDAAASASGRNARLVQSRTYSYRPDGRVTEIDDHLSGRRTFDLDPAGRVTAVSGAGWSERYAYDSAGNVAQASWPEGDAAAATDALGTREYAGTLIRRAGRVRYEHDAQGRVVLRQQKRASAKPRTWRYAWSDEDRLVAVTTPGGEHWCYEYDALGRRIAKYRLATVGRTGERVDFTWDGTVLAEQSDVATGRVSAWEYEPGTFRPVSQTARTRGLHAPQEWVDEAFHAIVTDLVGTPTEMVDANGKLAWHASASLWGVPVTRDGGADCPIRFPGQYADTETGDNYNFFRYYDPVNARYQSSDPLGLVAGPNPHAFVANPTEWTDPLGLFGCHRARSAPRALPPADVVLIGKVDDLTAATLRPGERTLLNQLQPSLGSPRANYIRNDSVLRAEMGRGVPIRDVSVDPVTGALRNNTGFLRAERNVLTNHDWAFDPKSGCWAPPGL